MKRWILLFCVVAAALICFWLLQGRESKETTGYQKVLVARSSVTRKAVAVGRIEVEHEVPINSLNGGILTRLFVRQGQKVSAGTPLAEVRPVSNEQALLAAERNLEEAKKAEESATEYLERKHIASRLTSLFTGSRSIERMRESAALGRKEAEERLELLKSGAANVNNRVVDFIVRAPVEGHVLEIKQRVGTPVVPASSYGFGTVFMSLADMNKLLFRGTVDEIDVGRLTEGMEAVIKVGALPGVQLKGKLVEIALKGLERNNAMVFDVLIELESPGKLALRSGYSAVAEIEIEKRINVITLPERLVEFRSGKAFVRVPDRRNGSVSKEIETGLSDGFIVEIIKGLAEGDAALEPSEKSL